MLEELAENWNGKHKMSLKIESGNLNKNEES